MWKAICRIKKRLSDRSSSKQGTEKVAQQEQRLEADNRSQTTSKTTVRVHNAPRDEAPAASTTHAKLSTEIDSLSNDLPADLGSALIPFQAGRDLDISAPDRALIPHVELHSPQGSNVNRLNIFEGAQQVVVGSLIVNTENVRHIHVEDKATTVLQALPRQVGTSWDPSKTCLPGTRRVVLDAITTWALEVNPMMADSSRVFLIADAAGSGKSFIAHSVSEAFWSSGHLLASFFPSQFNLEHSSIRHLLSAVALGLSDADFNARMNIVGALSGDSSLARAPAMRLFNELVLPACHTLPRDRLFILVIDALDELYDPDLLTILRTRVLQLPPNLKIVVTTRPEDRIMKHLENASHISRYPYPLTGIPSSPDIRAFVEHQIRQNEDLASISIDLQSDLVAKSEGVFLWASIVLSHIQSAFDPITELQNVLTSGSGFWAQSQDARERLETLYARVLAPLPSDDPMFVKAYQTVIGTVTVARSPVGVGTLAELVAYDGMHLAGVVKILKRLRPLLARFDGTGGVARVMEAKGDVKLADVVQLVHLSVKDYLTQRAPQPYRIEEESHHLRLSLSLLKILDEDVAQNGALGYTEKFFLDPASLASRESQNHCSLQILAIPTLDATDVTPKLWYACLHLLEHLDAGSISGEISQWIDHTTLFQSIVSTKSMALLETTASMGKMLDIWHLKEWWHAEDTDCAILLDVAANLIIAGLFLEANSRVQEARTTADGVVGIFDSLEGQGLVPPAVRAWALSLRAQYLEVLGQYQEAKIDLHRSEELYAYYDHHTSSTIINELRASVTGALGRTLYRVNSHDEALGAVGKAVDSYSSLLSTLGNGRRGDQYYFSMEYSAALALQSKILRGYGWKDVEMVKAAANALEKSLSIQRREWGDKANEGLGESFMETEGIENIIWQTSTLGISRHEGIMRVFKHWMKRKYYHVLLGDPSTRLQNLILSLTDLSRIRRDQKRHEEALEAVDEGTSLFYQSSDVVLNEGCFSEALYEKSRILSLLGRNDEACDSASKAVDILRALREKSPEVMQYRMDMVSSLIRLSATLSDSGKYGEALDAIQEAVDMYRDPGMDTGKRDRMLSWTLGKQGKVLIKLGRLQEANEVVEEGIRAAREVIKRDGSYKSRVEKDLKVLLDLQRDCIL